MMRWRTPILSVSASIVWRLFLLIVLLSSFQGVVGTEDSTCNNGFEESHEDGSSSSCTSHQAGEDLKGVNDSHSQGPSSDMDKATNNNNKLTGTSTSNSDREQSFTIQLEDEVLHRIYVALQADDVVTSGDKDRMQQIALNEFNKWNAEEEASRHHRDLLQRQRIHAASLPESTTEFPYTMSPPPPPKDNWQYSLDFCRNWTPPGGNRYTEYAMGRSPYRITPALRNQSDAIARLRRPYIQQAMQHAWDGYRQYAFGDDEVRPQSKIGTNHWGGISVTLVDSLDTLFLMNMTEEFQQARDYVRDTLSHDQNRKVSVFETTIRSLGGLLSAYDWSRDEVFLEEAMDLARRLMRAFEHPVTGETILPFGEVNLRNGSCNMIPWAGGNAILSEFGTLQIEFRYLDEIMQTGETRAFRDKVESIFEMLHEMSPENGLFPYYMKTEHSTNEATKASSRSASSTNKNRPTKPYFANDHVTFGAMADSFYEYMLKIWLQGGKKEPMYRQMYDKAIQGMHDELLHVSTPSGLMYLADKIGGKSSGKRKRTHHKMDHLCCFVGGMLALGAYTDPLGLQSERAQRDLETAKALTYTCYQMYARMKTGISPEYVEFVPGEDFKVGKIGPHYLLRPEAVESFYILNFLTGDPIYREWGWEVFQSIEKYCKTHVAYGSLRNVQLEGTPPRDDMESFFMAETLKYLYLLNDPDSKIDILNTHVFNTEAHPMRIFPVIQEELRREAEEL